MSTKDTTLDLQKRCPKWHYSRFPYFTIGCGRRVAVEVGMKRLLVPVCVKIFALVLTAACAVMLVLMLLSAVMLRMPGVGLVRALL